jgi:SNF2 family DNA or RNA helicase
MITQLKELCPICGKTAVEKFKFTHLTKEGDEVSLITLSCFHVITHKIPKNTPFESMVSYFWKDEIKNCNHEWEKTQCIHCGEYKLYPFQITGAKHAEISLSTSKGFGIFDDMGLGKTVQALAYIKFHEENTPILFVVKSAIKYNWFKEIIRWLGPTFLPQVISSSKDFILPNLKAYIIPYDLLRRMKREKLAKIPYKLVVIDECQQIKNDESTRTQEVRMLIKRDDVKILALSGTPWKNRGSEYFPVLNMIAPTKFSSHAQFIMQWVDSYFHGDKIKEGGIRNIEKFKEYTKDILIRREYEEVMEEFPSVNRTKITVKLSDVEQHAYNDATSDFVKWYNDKVIGGEEDAISSIEMIARMARMRHIAGLSKIIATVDFVNTFVEDTDRKLVIFTHHKDVSELLYQEIVKLHGHLMPVYHLTSSLSDEQKFNIQERFNLDKRAIIVASTLACGEGMNFQSCSDAVMHERQWNPQNEDQAAPGRFKRIGQKASIINITFMQCDEVIEEMLDNLVERKRLQYHKAMNKSEVPSWNEGDMIREIAEAIVSKFKKKNKDNVVQGNFNKVS